MQEHQHRKIAVGSDHAGYRYKELVRELLDRSGLPYQDFGAYSEESTDYPDYALMVSKAVASGQCCCGILICGTGVGMSLVANKVPGIRAAVCNDTYTARVSRLHNDANVLCLAGRVIGVEVMLDIVRTWIATPFSGEERHVRRLQKLKAIEEAYLCALGTHDEAKMPLETVQSEGCDG
ncbi:MAG: ribose 5-phosphate isomerase B [Armatimonadota bacterium]